MRHSLLFAACIVTYAPCAAQKTSVEELLAQAEPAIQEQIRTTVTAFLSGNPSESEIKTNWKGFRELSKLKELADDEERLISQLAIFAVVEQRPEETQVLEALLVLQLLNLKPSIPIRVLAPYLNSDNEQFREFVRGWFQGHDSGGSGKSVNYKDYSDYVSRQLNSNDQVVPAGFVEYIFERSPDQALLVFMRAGRPGEITARLNAIRERMEAARQQEENSGQDELLQQREHQRQKLLDRQRAEERREILLAAHIVDNAIWLKTNGFDQRFPAALAEANEQLAKLSAHDQWWVRLYVAEIMRRHRELRQDDVLGKLRGDRNASVSKVAKSVKG